MELIENLINELSYRVGVPDLKNKEHQSVMSEILTEWGEIDAKYIIMDFLNEAPKTPDLKKTTGDEAKYTHIGRGIYVAKGDENKENAQKFEKDESGALKPISNDEYEKRKAQQGDAGEDAAATKNAQTAARMNTAGETNAEKQQPETGTSLATPEYQANIEKEKEIRDRLNNDTEDVDSVKSDEEIKSELDIIQNELQRRRDEGDAGMGGAVASQGESRFCNTLNTLNYDTFKNDNLDVINSKKQEYLNRTTGRNKYPSASEWEIIRAMGYGEDPTNDEVLEYLSARELFAEKELERIKQDENSVFYKKKGFGGNDEAYLEWSRAAFDGAIATKKILEEDTILDVTKPYTTIQSESKKGEVDDKVQDILQKKLEKAKKDGNTEDIDHYTAEVKSFEKFRKYHDTYVVGQDKNGRTTVVSISNKKGSDLKDPQNNTTPANRFKVIKDQYGDDVAKVVTDSLDEGIVRVGDTKLAAINRTNRIDIDDSIVAICETPEMSKYMKNLDNSPKFVKYVESKGKSLDNMTTREKLELMKEHSALLLDMGKIPAFDPYGKIATKIGEFTQIAKYKNQYPNIDFDTNSVSKCISIKQDEKDAVSAAHKQVVNDISDADSKLGFPKDGINGPHTQGYISTIMDAMHFDSYIDGGDGKMIIQMGIRGAQPKDIRSCLAKQSGFNGDVNTTEGKDALKKHLRERCRIDAKSGTIIVSDGTGERSICEDTWRTAGTAQKVASGFGDDMRRCIKKSVDNRRITQ